MAGPGEDVEAREVGQVEERGWQTLALGPGRGEGEADPPWDFAGTSAAGEGRARGQVGLGGGEEMAGPGDDVEAQEVGQVEERGWQTLALGSGRGEGKADPPWDPAVTSAAGEGRARGQVGPGVGE